MANPPALAEGLLQLLLPPESRESVSGDLLEEYRESRLPSLGRLRANAWYRRQVVGLFLRVYGWFALPLVLLIVVHDLSNTFRDPSGASYLDGLSGLARAPLSPWIGIGAFVFAAAYGTWRTGRWAAGFAASVGLFIVMWLFMAVWWNATLYPFAQVQQHNPYWVQAWQWSTHRPNTPSFFGFNPDTPDEPFLQWIFWDNVGALFFLGMTLAAVSTVCGAVGSTMARACQRVLARRAAISQ